MAYSKIIFKGNIRDLEQVLKSKLDDSNLKVKKINDQTAVIESDHADINDQILYIKDSDLGSGITIISSDEATQNDMTTASSMGFEVINKDDDSVKTTVSKLLEETTDKDEKKADKTETKEKTGNTVTTGNTGSAVSPKDSLNKAIMDTTLNSKTPLRKEDAFYFLIQKNFVTYAWLGASALVFVSSLF